MRWFTLRRLAAAVLVALAATFILTAIIVPNPPAACEGIDNPILRWILGCGEDGGSSGAK
jgi:hypothetical protein